MDRAAVEAERARLMKLLDGYDGDRADRQEADERKGLDHSAAPDRAGNVRARIARLDELLRGSD